jgi:thymidylate synthase
MKQYLDLLDYVLENGEKKGDRTGTGTISHFGAQLRFDLREGFPLLTTKKVLFSSILHELLWFLKGSTNIYEGLNPHTKIWDAWADKDGNLGPVYGFQWRNWEKFTWDEKESKYKKTHVDQIKEVINSIKNNPDSRRHIVSAWNVADIDSMALPPCHSFFQFYVCNGHLDCQLYQRSADLALGVPFNIASYALLLMMVAQECNLIPRNFVHTFGDAHIYQNHVDGVKSQLTRTPGKLPQVKIAKKPLFELEFNDFEVLDYDPQAFIKFPIAV